MGLRTPCAGTRPGAADPKRSRAAYPPPRLVLSYIDTEIDHKLRKNSREQVIRIYSKMTPKSIQNGSSGASFLGGRGSHFGTILKVWADSGSQMQSWAVLVVVLVANMAPTWLPKRSQNR